MEHSVDASVYFRATSHYFRGTFHERLPWKLPPTSLSSMEADLISPEALQPSTTSNALKLVEVGGGE